MANKKKTKEEQPLVQNLETVSVPKENTEVSAASHPIENKVLDDITKSVESFGDIDSYLFNDYEEWENLFNKYQEITKSIDDYADSIDEYEYASVKDRIETLFSELNYYNDKHLLKYNSWTVKKGKGLEERSDKQQLLNFAVFSLFMTLLTFLLSNIVVITKTDFSVKTIVVINLVLLLTASVVFLFIGLFFGLVKKRSKAGYVAKCIILSFLPFLIATALILVSILMK